MAAVYAAVAHGAHGFSRRVAIKRLLPELSDDPTFVRMFLDEARTVSRLHHAGIVAVVDYGIADGKPFHVLELVEGRDASAVVRRALAVERPMPVEVALYVACEIAQALHYAHTAMDEHGQSLGIVHRDVKPSNILLSRSGDVKLGDFGVAKARERAAATTHFVPKGTLAFMAPEQLLGGAVDGRTDVFALGCSLCALLDGKSPLLVPGAREALLLESELPLPSTLPTDVAAVVAKAVKRLIDDRFASAAEMANALGEAMVRRLRTTPRKQLVAWLSEVDVPLPADAAMRETYVEEIALASTRAGTRQFVSRREERAPTTTPLTHAPTATTSGEAPLPHSSPSPGSSFGPDGRYLIEELVGRGGMGTVYRALDTRTRRRVAIKLLGPATDRRALREAHLAAKLRHPNVVTVYDVGESDGIAYLTMELLQGRSLRTEIERGPIPPAQATRWLGDIAAGLKAAHAAGVIHRDVKPENLIVGDEGTLKIVDFGIANAVRSGGARIEATIAGTPRYMAPEQQLGLPLDVAVDQFAWGVVAYELLSGRSPWTANDRASSSDPVPLSVVAPHLPRGAHDAVMRAIARDPRARFASVEQAARTLARALTEDPYAARAVAAAPSATSSRRSAHFAVVAGLLATGTAFAAIAVAVAARTGPRPSGAAERDESTDVADASALSGEVDSAPVSAETATPASAPAPSSSATARPPSHAAAPTRTTSDNADAGAPPAKRVAVHIHPESGDPETLGQVAAMEPLRPRIEPCFAGRTVPELDRDPLVSILVQPDGTVTSVRAGGSPVLQLCLRDVFTGAKLRPNREGSWVLFRIRPDASN